MRYTFKGVSRRTSQDGRNLVLEFESIVDDCQKSPEPMAIEFKHVNPIQGVDLVDLLQQLIPFGTQMEQT